jgi:hypothetical protein
MATEVGPIFPFKEPIAGSLLVTPRWRRWLLDLRDAVDLTPISVPIDPQTNQSASLPVTSMDGGNLPAGLYAISWYLSIVTTEAASTVQVRIDWIDDVGAKSYTATALNGAVANNTQPDVKILIYSAAASPITYTVTYVGATMVYSFRPVLQSTATS